MNILPIIKLASLALVTLTVSAVVVFAGVDEADEAPQAAPAEVNRPASSDPDASNSFLVTSENAPAIDKEAVFHRWARRKLADNRTVRDLRFGPVFESFSSLIPPVMDWMMCGEFNARSAGGGYAGLVGFLFVLRQDDANKWKIQVARSDRHAHYREHCLKFEKNG